MPKTVVEIPTITPSCSLRRNCISISASSAKTIKKSSQLLVSSNLNNIESGIIAPIPIPKYLNTIMPFFSNIVKNSYKPAIINAVIPNPHHQSYFIVTTSMPIKIAELIILRLCSAWVLNDKGGLSIFFINLYSAKSSFSSLVFSNCLL